MERLYTTLLYYWYTPIENAAVFASEHLALCMALGLKGRVIVADEGINGTVSGLSEACKQYMDALHTDSRFSEIDFKIDRVEKPSFMRMHCRYKSEIVHSGLRTLKPHHLNRTAPHLDAKAFQELKAQDNVVLLDVRSNYEHQLGKFKHAVTLDIDHFREFPEKIKELYALRDKKVITYCTGGVKCEKASAYLLQEGFSDVYQLKGGIIKYGKEAGGKDFDGKCYVFDNRISVEVNTVNPLVVSVCRNCGKACDKMINCANPECNEHFSQCDACGNEMQGCCSTACRQNPRKRVYDGSGYYVRGVY